MVYMQQRHSQQVSRHDLYVTTYKMLLVIHVLYIDIICIAKWLYGASFQILHCSGVFARQELFKPENTFKQKRANLLLRKYDVISQLHHSDTKGPF